MTPTPRAAYITAAIAVAALIVPPVIALTAFAVVAVATITDLVFARPRPMITRTAPRVLARGVPARLVVETDADDPNRVEIRQPLPPDITIDPSLATQRLDARAVAQRRGANTFPPVALRSTGPLGLGRRTWAGKEAADVLVYPDVVAAQRLIVAMRRGRFRDPGLRTRGPLGLGTDFEAIRDYLPDDDVRLINWQATERVGRPMSNVYRIEQDRDVVCLLDTGRLMAAPISQRLTRLDAAVDAVTMVAMVADELGDRCGVTVFDTAIRRRLAPRRRGGRAVVNTILDVEPSLADTDHNLAFRTIGSTKRALVLVCTDLVDDAAARSLIDAVPIIARRHAVVVASVRDPDLEAPLYTRPHAPHDVYAAAIALDVLEAKQRVAARLRHAGAVVVEAPPALLGEACVRAYLRLKARARL
jgi:uncharacterized protein (DUF58 family)